MTTMNDLSEMTTMFETSPKLIEMRLGFLIRSYLQTRAQELAIAIVKQLEILLGHPDCIGYPNERCGYQKMLIQWRAIAA